MTVQFPAKFSSGTAERQMLPLILCWGCTLHKMQGTSVHGSSQFGLSRVKLLNGLRLDELDCDLIN
jgi:hypothetical protein